MGVTATRDATDVVFVSPLYWYMVPAPLKGYLDHWSAWLRAFPAGRHVPGARDGTPLIP